jgi:hypothetical protein
MSEPKVLPAWAALLLMVTGLVVLLGPPARADEASHWSAERAAARATEDPSSISCPSFDSCTAIAGFGSAFRYDGDTWGQARPADGDRGAVSSVSCPTTTFCGAVGQHVVVVEKNGHWGHVSRVDPSLEDVSCSSARWCLAVGDAGRSLRYDGGRWRAGPRASGILESVSCVSRRFCMAESRGGTAYRFDGRRWHRAGDLSAVQSLSNGLACGSRSLCLVAGLGRVVARWNGRHWIRRTFSWLRLEDASTACGPHFCQLLTTAHAVEWHHGWGPVSDIPPGQVGQGPSPVSCSTRGRCVALTNTYQASTLVLRDGSWHEQAFRSTSVPPAKLSCPTPAFCMAIAFDRSWVRRDGAWTPVAMPAGLTNVLAVDCVTASSCLAVGSGGAAKWDGTSWGTVPSPGADYGEVSCASTTYCLAAEEGESDGAIEVWDGADWSSVRGPGDLYPESLSCPAVDDCWAGGGVAAVSHFDGTTWSTPEVIAPGGDDGNSITVSCPTSSMCAAIDQLGNTYRYVHGAWGHHVRVGGRHPMVGGFAFDCGSASSCTVAFGNEYGLQADVARWNGSSWTTSRALPRGYAGQPMALSCASTRDCVMTDANGTAWVRS